MQKGGTPKTVRKPQRQRRPGKENAMMPQPKFDYPELPGGIKLLDKVALITGADSGIGKAVAILFAKQGADIAIVYLNEHEDALNTKQIIENTYQRKCLLIPGDVSKESFCKNAVQKTLKTFNKIDILVNNAAIHYESKSLEEISTGQLLTTFKINIFSFFWMSKFALKHMKPGSNIINTSSVTAYRGSTTLIDYASTKGAIINFTRSLAGNLVKKNIRVNAVAPGPIWTALITSSFTPSKVAAFGSDSPMERAGQPAKVAPAFLFLACNDASYITGQVIHPNGGEIING